MRTVTLAVTLLLLAGCAARYDTSLSLGAGDKAMRSMSAPGGPTLFGKPGTVTLPCRIVVSNPEELKSAAGDPGPICILVDGIAPCVGEQYCEGWWVAPPPARR